MRWRVRWHWLAWTMRPWSRVVLCPGRRWLFVGGPLAAAAVGRAWRGQGNQGRVRGGTRWVKRRFLLAHTGALVLGVGFGVVGACMRRPLRPGSFGLLQLTVTKRTQQQPLVFWLLG